MQSRDPVDSTGWVDGQVTSRGDRRLGLSSGPFNMAVGDIQEIIFAEAVEMGQMLVNSRVNNISGLKRKIKNLKGFIRNGAAADISGNKFVSINSNAEFHLNIITLNNNATVSDVQWTVKSAPPGSNSRITMINAANAAFNPDVAGKYILQVSATISGKIINALFELEGLNNAAPTAHFTLSKNEARFGEPFIADASSSSDPGGLPLTYIWEGTGLFEKTENGKKVSFTPSLAGSNRLSLRVTNDIFSSDSVYADVNVLANTKNIQESFSYRDNERISNYLMTGDTIIGMISSGNSEANKLKIFKFAGSGMQFEQYAYIPGITDNLTKLLMIKNNCLIFLTGGRIGSGNINICTINENWQFNNILSNWVPEGYGAVLSVDFYDDHNSTVITETGVYNVDFFSSPGSPAVRNQYILNSENSPLINGSKIKGNSIYLSVRYGYSYKYDLFILDRNSLTIKKQIPLNFSMNDFEVKGDYIYEDNNTAVQVHHILDNSIQDLGSYDLPFSSFWTGTTSMKFNFVDKDLLAVEYLGVTFYKTDNAVLNAEAYWYDGYNKHLVKNSGSYYLVSSEQRFPSESKVIGVVFNPGVMGTEDENKIPGKFDLLQNYPNPFNPETKITYFLPYSRFVTLKVYDILGNVVTVLVSEEKPAGSYEVKFNAAGLASGVYFYKIQAGDYTAVKKLILVK